MGVCWSSALVVNWRARVLQERREDRSAKKHRRLPGKAKDTWILPWERQNPGKLLALRISRVGIDGVHFYDEIRFCRPIR